MLIIEVLLPLFILIGLGWCLLRCRILSEPGINGVNALTAQVLMPALLFLGAYQNGLPDAVTGSVLLAFYLPMLLLFFAVWRAFKTDGNRAALALTAVYSNTAFVGIPVLSQALGPGSLRYAFPIIAFHSLLAFSLYFLASAAHGSGARRQALLRTLGHPIVASLALGLLANTLRLPVPAALVHTLELLSKAALPCALCGLGAALAQLQFARVQQTLAVTLAKLIALPVLVLLCARYVFQIPAEITAVLLVMAACPVGVNSYPIVHRDGHDTTVVSSSILLSSVLAMLTLPLWLGVLAHLP